LTTSELGQGTTEGKPNPDGTLKEPEFPPPRIPNLNPKGGTGKAGGKATDIPPHNIKEIAKPREKWIKKPDNSWGQLTKNTKKFQGPEFPTGGKRNSSARGT
jgi:Type IIA topoisomerase (DNA gyrase/topo II, topoisomerase IV), A subunit